MWNCGIGGHIEKEKDEKSPVAKSHWGLLVQIGGKIEAP